MEKKFSGIVVKLGSSTLTYDTGHLNIRRVEELVKILSDIKNSGIDVVLVSSGAVAVGVGKMGLKERPSDTPTKQAAAAVGQCELMYLYDKLFAGYNHTVAQLLVDRDVIEHEVRKQNVINTLGRLLSMDIIPIINENDTVSVEEIEFGDNDTLSAVMAVLCQADKLVIMSDIDGLYTANPNQCEDAALIPEVREITDELYALAGGTGSNRGTGGMITKLHAAEIAMENGIEMVIINGKHPKKLYDVVEGKPVGTRFVPNRN